MIIPDERINFLSDGIFNHCSCVCPLESGITLVTWYSGTNECYNDQSVVIARISGNGFVNQIKLHPLTGNPIIWNEGGRCWILYSEFKDNPNIARLVDRWKFCNLFIQEININDWIQLVGDPIKIADAEQHLLARCRPIVINNITYIPLYDEVARCCVLFIGKDGLFKEHCRFGDNIIQPTIWTRPVRVDPTVPIEFIFNALCRNFGNRKTYSQYYYSQEYHAPSESTIDNIASVMTHGGDSKFLNVNNSIHVTRWDKYDNEMVLWNDCDTQKRTDLTLGEIRWDNGVPVPHKIAVVGAYGSYPSLACTDDHIYFTFTNVNMEIEYHEWNRKKYERESEISRRRNRY